MAGTSDAEWRRVFFSNLRSRSDMSSVQNVVEILEQWRPDRVEDTGDYGSEQCICGHDIRYKYYIMNKKNNQEMFVGSHCIHKFTKFEPEFDHASKISKRRQKHTKKEKCLRCAYTTCKCDEISTTTCPMCDRIIFMDDWQDHLRRAHHQMYCRICNSLVPEDDYDDHKMSHYRQCLICNAIIRKTQYEYHEWSHYNRCPICEMRVLKDEFEQHKQTHYKNCPNCNDRLAPDEYDQHQHYRHPREYFKNRKVGFGKFTNLSWVELVDHQPSYVNWIMDQPTFRNSGMDTKETIKLLRNCGSIVG